MSVTVVTPESKEVVGRSGPARLERYASSLGHLDIVHVYGSPEEMGRQYGELLGEGIRRILGRTLSLFGPDVPAEFARLVLAKAWERLLPYVPDVYLAEMHAIAEGAAAAGVSLEASEVALITAATNMDMYKVEERLAELLGPEAAPLLAALARNQTPPSCTMLAVWGSRTQDGKLFAHRNLDWKSQTGMHEERLVTVYHPDGGNTFVTMGYAGVIGALAGMNEHGITLSEVGAFSASEELDGMPWTLTARRVLHEAKTLEEAVGIVTGAKHTLGYNYLIADGDPERFGTDAYRPRAAAIETNHTACEVFHENDPKEAAASWADAAGNKVTYGVPLREAVMRADTAFGEKTRALQAADNGPGEPENTGDPTVADSTYVQCHRPMHDMVLAYERGEEYVYPLRKTKVIEAGAPRKIGPEEMLTVAATVAHNVEKLKENDWNVMSVVYDATGGAFWLAYEACNEAGQWTNAPDSGYWRFDLKDLLAENGEV